MSSTSTIAAAIAVEGLLLQIGDGGSPEQYQTIANVEDWDETNKSDVVDVTNVGDEFRRRIATLLDMGPMKFKIFWVMTEATHWNEPGAVDGIRYIWRHRILAAWRVIYPNGLQSSDSFLAYVTNFHITGKVGGVFEAEVELNPNDGAPSLC